MVRVKGDDLHFADLTAVLDHLLNERSQFIQELLASRDQHEGKWHQEVAAGGETRVKSFDLNSQKSAINALKQFRTKTQTRKEFMNRLKISKFSQEEFIEFAYIAGLHKRANIIANVLGLEDLLKHIQKYDCNLPSEKKFSEELNNELNNVEGLCDMDQLEFLRDSASALPPGSNILEIGTYVGGTSLALLQGAKYSKSKYTSVDVYAGFTHVKHATNHISECMHWEHLEWQNNTSKYAELVTSYHGCSIPVLRDLVREQKKFDLIFVDTAHELDSLAEFALISCLANDNCLFVLDDVIDFNKEMTSAWLMSLKYNFAFPKFFRSKYALARPKRTQFPLNFKTEISGVFEKVSEVAEFISSKIKDGCKVSIEKNEDEGTGFCLIFD